MSRIGSTASVDLVGRQKVVSGNTGSSFSPRKCISGSEALFCAQGVNAAFILGHKQGLKAPSVSRGDVCAGVNRNSCRIWLPAVLKATD